MSVYSRLIPSNAISASAQNKNHNYSQPSGDQNFPSPCLIPKKAADRVSSCLISQRTLGHRAADPEEVSRSKEMTRFRPWTMRTQDSTSGTDIGIRKAIYKRLRFSCRAVRNRALIFGNTWIGHVTSSLTNRSNLQSTCCAMASSTACVPTRFFNLDKIKPGASKIQSINSFHSLFGT